MERAEREVGKESNAFYHRRKKESERGKWG
jgi:hypothetical protein